MGFPTEFPAAEAKRLYQMLAGKTPRNARQFGHDLWLLTGFALDTVLPGEALAAVLDGKPKVQYALAGGAKKLPKISDAQAVELLGALAGNNKAKGAVKASGLLDLVGGKLRDQVLQLLLPWLVNQLKKFLTGIDLGKLLDGIIKA